MAFNNIHTVKVGDLVRRDRGFGNGELFMVIDVAGEPCALRSHEMTLKLWEVTEPPGHHHHAPASLYMIVGGKYESDLYGSS